eukprot:Sspe_Gene.82955::Locus_54391_Transcript_1_1_Confidence_1.000_Length_474::g.82955::m.82955
MQMRPLPRRRTGRNFLTFSCLVVVMWLLLVPTWYRPRPGLPLSRPRPLDPATPAAPHPRRPPAGVEVADSAAFTLPHASHGPQGALPIGNGDVAGMVWVDTRGGLSLLISKSDALDGGGNLFKLGRVE